MVVPLPLHFLAYLFNSFADLAPGPAETTLHFTFGLVRNPFLSKPFVVGNVADPLFDAPFDFLGLALEFVAIHGASWIADVQELVPQPFGTPGRKSALPAFRASDYDLAMPRLIPAPTVIKAAGTKPKRIEEYAGLVNSGHSQVSVARMVSPGGWQEPGQRPDFEEITVVLRGSLRVEHQGGIIDVPAGQAVVAAPGEWVRYSTPAPEGAEYIAVCIPAFSPQTVHREED